MKLRDAFVAAWEILEYERARRECPELYRHLDAARLAPTPDVTSEELTAAEERLVRRVADRLAPRVIAELQARLSARESELLFPRERAEGAFRVAFFRALRRRTDSGDEPAP